MKKAFLALLFCIPVFGQQAPDPCSTQNKISLPISISASAQIITGITGTKIHVCSIVLTGATATTIAIVEGTGTTCGTGTTGIFGGATAATGVILAINGQFIFGDGSSSAFSSNTISTNICLLLSAANQINGVVSYTIQ